MPIQYNVTYNTQVFVYSDGTTVTVVLDENGVPFDPQPVLSDYTTTSCNGLQTNIEPTTFDDTTIVANQNAALLIWQQIASLLGGQATEATLQTICDKLIAQNANLQLLATQQATESTAIATLGILQELKDTIIQYFLQLQPAAPYANHIVQTLAANGVLTFPATPTAMNALDFYMINDTPSNMETLIANLSFSDGTTGTQLIINGATDFQYKENTVTQIDITNTLGKNVFLAINGRNG
ncbi:MAG: hypothetical protein ACPG5B_06780 [Chitinophagales bacterium]